MTECTGGFGACYVLTKEMAAGVVAAVLGTIGALIGAFLGGRATRAATLQGIQAQQQSERQREEAARAEEQRNLAHSIQAEMMALRQHYSEHIEPLLRDYQHGSPAPVILVNFNYFIVFERNCHRIGLFDPAHALALVRCYMDVKGFFDSLNAFLRDPRCEASRVGELSGGEFYFIDERIAFFHGRGQDSMLRVAETVTTLDVYL